MRREILKGVLAFWSFLAGLCGIAQAQTNSQQIYLQCLTNFETYAETVWHSASYSGAPADSGYFGDGNSSGNGGIRGSSGVALGYAVLCVAYPADAKFATRLSRVRQALNYNAATHVSGTNKCVNGAQWGWSSSAGDWQTPMWTAMMGTACLLVQSNLPPATVAGIQHVIESEANHRAAIAPPSGYVSDSKAEENAWDSNLLALGAAWMNTNASAANWLTAAKQYLANSYTVANTNGDPLAAWITTVTCYPSYAVENHGFYHPGYQMVTGMELGDSWLMARLANTNKAAQLTPFAEHNVLPVWTNLNHTTMDSGEMAFPAGEDWALHDFGQNSYLAWLAVHFNDPVARWAEARVAALQRFRQAVNGTGQFIGPSGGGFYREAVCAYRTAMAWLQWSVAEHPTGVAAPAGNDFIHMPDLGIIEQRGANGFVSISYGRASRVMAIIEAPAASFADDVYTVTPRLPGVIGLGAMGTPTAARLVNLTNIGNAFQAELQLTNGANGTTEVYVDCTGESVAILEVPWPANGVANAAAASFITGIENAPLTGGTRLLEWSGGSAVFTNRSGATQNITNKWVCVAGHYGLAAGPGGYFNYTAASGYTRVTPAINEAGTAEDTLQFFPTNSLAPRYAVYFPGNSALQTSNRAAQIIWASSGTNATLTFPGPGGAPRTLTALVPAAAPAYSPYALPISNVTASSSQAGFPPASAVDGNYANYWVSLVGPTNHAEWLQVAFPRPVAVSELKVFPRTDNGGYGPKDIQMFFNVTNAIPASGIPTSGTNACQVTLAPTTALDVRFPQPVLATNAVLVIASAYDRGVSTNPRNVQVNELVFFERALPGTFGDWAVRRFNDTQLADASVSDPGADPDGDGGQNLLEFTMGGQPLTTDAANFRLQPRLASGSQFALRFRQRKDLVGVTRQFLASTNLAGWVEITPLQVNTIQDLGEVNLLEAFFSVTNATRFFRLAFHQ